MTCSDSKVIDFLRFPLICAVVCIHCNLLPYYPSLENYSAFSTFTHVFINFFCSIANPLFFFISGFLFFKSATFSKKIYLHKISRRIHSLLIPYVIWILFYFFIIVILQLIKPHFTLLLHKSIINFTPKDFLFLFWNLQQVTHLPTDQAAPLVTQFWFIQCLMVCVLISPIIWLGVKHIPLLFICSLGIISMFECLPEYPGIIWFAFFYFSLGAYFSIHQISFSNFAYHSRYYQYILLIAAIICSFFCQYVLFLLNIFMLFVIINISTFIVNKNITIHKTIVASSFFIFAFHRLLTAVVTNLPKLNIIHINSEFSAFIYYFISTTITIILCLFVYYIMSHYFTRLTIFISGGRTYK